MDSTIIKEIGEQMGMAVTSTQQFLADILPRYGMMKALDNIPGLILSSAFIIASIIVMSKACKSLKAGEDKEFNYVWQREEWIATRWIAIAVSAAALLFALIIFTISLRDALLWGLYPDTMFLDQVIHTVTDHVK